MWYGLATSDVQLRQPAHDFHRPEAGGDDALEQFEWIGRIADRLDGVAVGVVDDATVLVGFHALALHHLFESRLAVHHAIVRGKQAHRTRIPHLRTVTIKSIRGLWGKL